MKHATYLQRISRHIGTTAVLVPSRRIWNATSERVPVIVDDVPVAEVAATQVGRSAPVGQAEARPTFVEEAIAEAIAEVEGEIVRHPIPAKSREEHENVGWASARPARAEADELPTVSEDAPAPEGGRLKPALRSATEIVSGAVGEELHRPSQYESLEEAATEPVRLADIAASTAAPRTSTQQAQLQAQTQAQLHAATATATATAASAQESSVHIGTIEVHIAPPAAPAPRPSPAPKSAPARLARGFASTFGLRQE